jgi:hypothetical protein
MGKLAQPLGGSRPDNDFCFRYGRLERRKQSRASESASRAELNLAGTDIGLLSNAVHDPLAHVAAKMKDQVANRVLMGSGTLPDLVVIQLRHASGELLRHLVEHGARGFKEKGCDLTFRFIQAFHVEILICFQRKRADRMTDC